MSNPAVSATEPLPPGIRATMVPLMPVCLVTPKVALGVRPASITFVTVNVVVAIGPVVPWGEQGFSRRFQPDERLRGRSLDQSAK